MTECSLPKGYIPVTIDVAPIPGMVVGPPQWQLHGHCQELALGFLPEAAVDTSLAKRFADSAAHAPSLLQYR
jgi:hypothetical protein